jgi:hypothetical protein
MMHDTFPLFLSFPFLENTSWDQPLSPFSKRKSFAQKYNRRPLIGVVFFIRRKHNY